MHLVEGVDGYLQLFPIIGAGAFRWPPERQEKEHADDKNQDQGYCNAGWVKTSFGSVELLARFFAFAFFWQNLTTLFANECPELTRSLARGAQCQGNRRRTTAYFIRHIVSLFPQRLLCILAKLMDKLQPSPTKFFFIFKFNLGLTL